MPLITPTYKALNAELHARDFDWGRNHTKVWIQITENIAQSYNVRSIIDYGAGKGVLGRTLNHRDVWAYDPCIEEFSAMPNPADLVVCLATLEHIEPDCLDEVLDHIQSLGRLVFLSITTVPSEKTLADGRNAHLIVRSLEWWLPQLLARWRVFQLANGGNNFCFFGKKR